jgi:glycosyltransferase involved in cell wall biosynthesis
MRPALSYVLTTRNKLPTLRESLKRLLEHRKADEEIVVVDGGSSDGTPAFLADLAARGLVDDWVSEPDGGEGEGFNKAVLRSRGDLVKIITDDDAFHWPGVEACRAFMVDHPEVDLLLANNDGVPISDPSQYSFTDFTPDYERWRETGRPFFSGGLGILLRRRSLALTGLFHSRCVLVDVEFTLRATSRANVAWYKGVIARRLTNARSNMKTRDREAAQELDRWLAMYDPGSQRRRRAPSLASRLRHAAGRVVRGLGLSPSARRRERDVQRMLTIPADPAAIARAFDEAEAALARLAREATPVILHRAGATPG